MKTLPYATSFISDDDKRAVMRVLDRNYLTRGVEMLALEDRLCQISGKKYAVAMSNATVALWAVVKAIGLQEVWSSTLTYSAIENAATLNYADLHLVDVDVDTLCGKMPTAWNGIDDAIYVPMDYAGYPSLDKPIPHTGGPFTLLDASHSIGATLSSGYSNTSYADAAVFSLHAVKVATGAEGGAVVTDDEGLVRQLRSLRNNGFEYKTHRRVGGGLNLHMDELSCALALSQLGRLDKLLAERHRIAARYYEHWKDDMRVILPAYHPGHSFHLFAIRLSEIVDIEIEMFRAELEKLGVGTQRHYKCLHQITGTNYEAGNFPVAEHAYERMMSIPMYVGLTDDDIDLVITSIDRLMDKYTDATR